MLNKQPNENLNKDHYGVDLKYKLPFGAIDFNSLKKAVLISHARTYFSTPLEELEKLLKNYKKKSSLSSSLSTKEYLNLFRHLIRTTLQKQTTQM